MSRATQNLENLNDLPLDQVADLPYPRNYAQGQECTSLMGCAVDILSRENQNFDDSSIEANAFPASDVSSEIRSPKEIVSRSESTYLSDGFNQGYFSTELTAERLGAGGQGFVTLSKVVTDKNDDTEIQGWAAVKTSRTKEAMQRESQAQRFLTSDRKGSHRSGLLAWMAQRPDGGIVMPLCSMTLKEFSRLWMPRVVEEAIQQSIKYSVFLSLFCALKTLHDKRAVHNDIKDDNCMLRQSGRKISWVVTDFGSVCGIDSEGELPRFSPTKANGTPCFIAPEIVEGETPTFYSDIFSAGETLRRLLNVSFRIPFNDNSVTTLFDAAVAYAEARKNSSALLAESHQAEIIARIERTKNFDTCFNVVTEYMCSILPEERPDITTLTQAEKCLKAYLPENHEQLAYHFYQYILSQRHNQVNDEQLYCDISDVNGLFFPAESAETEEMEHSRITTMP